MSQKHPIFLKLSIFWFLLKLNLALDLNIVIWTNQVQKDTPDDLQFIVKQWETLYKDTKLNFSNVILSDDNEIALQTFCTILTTDGCSAVIDMNYYTWKEGLRLVKLHGLSYLKVDRMLKPFLNMFNEFMEEKEGNDIAMIFESEQDELEALIHITEDFPYRTMILNGMTDDIKRLTQPKPRANYYAIFAKGSKMNAIFEKIKNESIMLRNKEWHFVFLDAKDKSFKFKKDVEFANKFTMNPKAICRSMEMRDTFCTSGFTLQRAVLFLLAKSFMEFYTLHPDSQVIRISDCYAESIYANTSNYVDVVENLKLPAFLTLAESEPDDDDDDTGDDAIDFDFELVSFVVNISINFYSSEHEAVTDMALWTDEGLEKINETISPAKRFFRIGVSEAIPWSYKTYVMNSENEGVFEWEGFCIDYIKTLAEKLDFDYELVAPNIGTFGSRYPNGSWDGIIGDLVSGKTDLAVTALKMYSEREEVVDFIAPYFEQTGISIVIRKPVKQASLFKFMTVLRVEVWFSVTGALIATAFMLWIMDKYSPYSSRNDKLSYPYPCREFTLRESFWFALTSFTPQGGGEAPKAISGRILVAAYWLFVVLMLATFTANLAAFLTVERMQAPVQSLDQLARQSRINYTVVSDSDTHHYFINMKFAEDTLYRMWKELALNASEDYHKYRIWDYPIKEQYGHILLAINSSKPVRTAEEGFLRVNQHEHGDFAFIHDSAEIKYEVTQNCNLTEVGEVFAEQPYSIAVQQGSPLADEISYATLELQKDRYFEVLKNKYWNQSRLKNCPLSENQEGISLESLGGVFLATLFGLGLAMLTLALEVLFYKKKILKKEQNNPNVIMVEPKKEDNNLSLSIVEKPESQQSYEPEPNDTMPNDSKILLGHSEFRPRKLGVQNFNGSQYKVSDSSQPHNYSLGFLH